MEITTQQFEHGDLVKASGRIDSLTAPDLAKAFKALTDQGKYNLILDLSEVDYVSSAGLRVMIDIQKTCKRQGQGELILVGVPQRVYETLELAGFAPLFKLHEDAQTAIDSFSS